MNSGLRMDGSNMCKAVLIWDVGEKLYKSLSFVSCSIERKARVSIDLSCR